MNEDDEQRLRQILVTLTPQQLRYVAERYRHDSNADALRALNMSPDAPYRWPNRADVDEAVRLMAFDGVFVSRELLRRALPLAAVVKVAGLESADERIRQAAATEILDRFHGKPKQSIDTAVTGPVQLVMTWGDNDAGDGDAAEAA